ALQGALRLPLPRLVVRDRRHAARDAEDAEGVRPLAVPAEAGLRRRLERLRVRLVRARAAGGGRRVPAAGRLLELPDRSPEGLRRRGGRGRGELEGPLGERPRVLPLRAEPPRV